MLSVIQLVTSGQVLVNNEVIGAIDQGIVALVGIEKTDNEQVVEKLFRKILSYRIFPDEQGKTNLSLADVQGGLLLVPQFTLVADTNSGSRPSFSKGMAPSDSKELFEYFVGYAQSQYAKVASGRFGAYMQVSLCNDGPMTFVLRV